MRAACTLALTLLAGAAWGQDMDAAALSLPGSAPQAAESPRAWRLFAEAAAGHSVLRDASLAEAGRAAQRLSLDLQVDATLAPGLRAVLADRLDVDWQPRRDRRKHVNTLKEAYLSWQPRNDIIVDVGRVNQYSGVAIGYNPTDFFRKGAVRAPVSVDPASIKRDRQGSVMLRGQALWEGASLTALYSPALGGQPSSSAFDPDWGATNRRGRGMLIFSKRLSEDINPQWLLYKEQGAPAQLGMNLTKLVNDATVAYVEWSGGRSPTLLAQALGQEGAGPFRNRAAAGLTYTTSHKLSLTFEYQYNGAGLDKAQWDALPALSLPAYVRYREFAQSAQDMPTRRSAFFYASWQDLLVSHLDLTAMVRRNGDDGSRLSWAELRYRWTRDEVALQWQGHSGGLLSDYGVSPLRKAWQLSYRHFF
ncbi:hypothetical protein [Janthinobacterium fluminis]|uniref:Alginate export domain-containing protein n=1 Tax=Janthinobacterium fluminis TaxID=2987524 RepID=A0ABT5K0C8_9BURK|nr:hypothetical protein [Janthinobacterium fluminis]MDC8758424.1 hypothetical protein [Janthinobacterium fluminis]